MQATVDYRHKSFRFLRSENKNDGGYTAIVTNLIITDPRSEVITIIGQHAENNSNASVVGLSMRNVKNIQKFPRGFGQKFPNLKYLEIDDSAITQLRKEDFLYLGHLQGLWMPRNPIVSLPGDLFSNVQGLRFISFHKNKLKYIGHDLLKPLKSLKSANFEENTTIDFNYEDHKNGTEGLAMLNKEIATKCISLPKVNGTSPNEELSRVVELESRITLLEAKVRKLETDNKMLGAKLTQCAGLTDMVEIMQHRLTEVEAMFH